MTYGVSNVQGLDRPLTRRAKHRHKCHIPPILISSTTPIVTTAGPFDGRFPHRDVTPYAA
jgi:hypothetical protein